MLKLLIFILSYFQSFVICYSQFIPTRILLKVSKNSWISKNLININFNDSKYDLVWYRLPDEVPQMIPIQDKNLKYQENIYSEFIFEEIDVSLNYVFNF